MKPNCAARSAVHSSLSRSDKGSGTHRAALRINPWAILETISPPGADVHVSLYKDTSTKTCEHFASTSQSRRRQPVKSTPRAAFARRIDGLPSTHKPTRGFQSQQDRIQRAGRQLATLHNVGAG